MKMSSIFPAFIALMAIWATSFTPVSAQTLEQEMKKLINDYVTAYNAENYEGLSKFYTESAIVTASDGTKINGPMNMGIFFGKMFEAVDFRQSAIMTDLLSLCDDMVLVSGSFTLTGKVNNEEESLEQRGTFTALCKKVNGMWKIERHFNAIHPTEE